MGLLEAAMAVHPRIQKLMDPETGQLIQPLNFSLITAGADGIAVERLASAFARLRHAFMNRQFDFRTRDSELIVSIYKEEGLSPIEIKMFECWVLGFCELLLGHSFDYVVAVMNKHQPISTAMITYGLKSVAQFFEQHGAPTRIHLPEPSLLKAIIADGLHQSFEEGYQLLEKAAGFVNSNTRPRELIEEFDPIYAWIAAA